MKMFRKTLAIMAAGLIWLIAWRVVMPEGASLAQCVAGAILVWFGAEIYKNTQT